MSEHFANENFSQFAIESVVEAWNGPHENEDEQLEWPTFTLTEDDLFVVWFAFILGNWKALISTHVVPNNYWEVTYNREKGETYVDKYLKHDQVILEDNDD